MNLTRLPGACSAGRALSCVKDSMAVAGVRASNSGGQPAAAAARPRKRVWPITRDCQLMDSLPRQAPGPGQQCTLHCYPPSTDAFMGAAHCGHASGRQPSLAMSPPHAVCSHRQAHHSVYIGLLHDRNELRLVDCPILVLVKLVHHALSPNTGVCELAGMRRQRGRSTCSSSSDSASPSSFAIRRMFCRTRRWPYGPETARSRVHRRRCAPWQ